MRLVMYDSKRFRAVTMELSERIRSAKRVLEAALKALNAQRGALADLQSPVQGELAVSTQVVPR